MVCICLYILVIDVRFLEVKGEKKDCVYDKDLFEEEYFKGEDLDYNVEYDYEVFFGKEKKKFDELMLEELKERFG